MAALEESARGPYRVVVDTRPMWRILAGRTYRPVVLLVGVLLFAALYGMEPRPGLAPAGQKALAVFAICMVYWVTNVVPLMVTSILAMVLLPLTGVLPATETYALFGNEAVFFILGAFILAATLIKCGLSTRIAVTILRRFGHTPRTLLLSLFVMNALLSFFMSEHAVAAMTFPITVEIASVLRLRRLESNYGRALFLAMAWGTQIGGIATLLGGGRAPLAIGMLREATGQSWSFLQWTLAAWPIVAILMVAGWQVIVRCFPIDIASVRDADVVIEEKALRMGRPSVRERAIGLIMLATLAAWMVGGEDFGLASIALGAVVVIFAFGLLGWSDVEPYVNWGVLLMYGGAIALGSAMTHSGASRWIAEMTVSHWAQSPFAVVAIISAFGILLTEAMSHSAVVALLMPVALGIATQFHIDPRLMAPAVALPAGLAFTLPVGTPGNAIAYSSGYLRLRDMLLPGSLMVAIAWGAFNLVATYYWPLIGLRLSAS
ncbi:MAG TPA: DASS family sodium-coupled anion symporter [Candidatus Binatia bacterium]|jgi:sodium-dependent dicarboxylate transporter 2/3/5|nr:DASS family sodium-coupled anion symporter [Candidatus Binatia bacterium]